MPTTSDELTPAMVRHYIDREGVCCPFCASDNIEGSPVEADGDSCSGDVACHACGKQWRDVYALCAVGVLDENGRYKATVDPSEEGDDEEEEPVHVDSAHYRRGDWVRVKATAALRRIADDYGSTFYPSLVDDTDAMHTYDEVEPVDPAVGRSLSALADLVEAVEAFSGPVQDDLAASYRAACGVLGREPRTARKEGDEAGS